jgi:hypothetical protein
MLHCQAYSSLFTNQITYFYREHFRPYFIKFQRDNIKTSSKPNTDGRLNKLVTIFTEDTPCRLEKNCKGTMGPSSFFSFTLFA